MVMMRRRRGRVIGGLYMGQQGIVTQEETRGSLAKILPRVRETFK